MKRCLLHVVCALALTAGSAWAGEPASPEASAVKAEEAPVSAPPSWSMALRGGLAIFTGSQSKALGHLFQPTARLEGLYHATERLAVGLDVAASGFLQEDYSLIGATVVGRAVIYRGEIFYTSFGWGFGAGTAPAILWTDLTSDDDLTPWLSLSNHHGWWVVPDAFSIELDLSLDQLTVVSANLGLRVAF